LRRKANPSNIAEIEGIKDFLEADSMLAERIESWFDEATLKGVQQGMQQGRQEGRQEGIQVGLLKGQAGVLAKQLKLRFGSLPLEVVERLSGATAEELDGWVEAVLTAPSLSAVFNPSRHCVGRVKPLKTKTLRGRCPLKLPQQGNDSPAPHNFRADACLPLPRLAGRLREKSGPARPGEGRSSRHVSPHP
jgi:hypothetical protein